MYRNTIVELLCKQCSNDVFFSGDTSSERLTLDIKNWTVIGYQELDCH